MPSAPVKRLTITIDVAFGKDEPTPEDPGGDVYSNTERRPNEDTAPSIGFGRPYWEDRK